MALEREHEELTYQQAVSAYLRNQISSEKYRKIRQAYTDTVLARARARKQAKKIQQEVIDVDFGD